MSITDYLIDSVLVLLVLRQIREARLTTRTLVRPLVIVAIAVGSYLHGIPTAGNDLVLVAVIGAVGALIGLASGLTVHIRRAADGSVLSRAGWASAVFWVLGMGSRFAFSVWVAHGGGLHWLTTFSAAHSITSGEAWTVALLAMAVAEVVVRSGVMAFRRQALLSTVAPAPALTPTPAA